MEINERKVGKIRVIKLLGPAVINAHPEQLSQLVQERLEAGERLFLINLADCHRMDSLGVGELVKSQVAITRKEGVLKLAHPSLQLRSILTVAKLNEWLEIFESEQTAINSFGE